MRIVLSARVRFTDLLSEKHGLFCNLLQTNKLQVRRLKLDIYPSVETEFLTQRRKELREKTLQNVFLRALCASALKLVLVDMRVCNTVIQKESIPKLQHKLIEWIPPE